MSEPRETDWSKASWKKATKSEGGNGCVEIAFANGRIGVRDSKQKGAGPVLEFNATEWDAFLDGVGKGEFALPE